MEFLKKHYEKLILSVVLLGLAGVAATLPLQVNSEKQKEEERKQSLIGAKVTEYPPVNLTTNQQVLERVKSPIKFDIAGKHNLFNPVPWVQRPNGEVIKVKTGNEIGIGAVEVTAINPLRMIVTLDGVVPTTGAGGVTEYKYEITVVREGSGKTGPRAMNPGMTANGIGTLKEVQGPPDNPAGVVLELQPDRTQVVVSKEKPYTRVIGYAADFRYDPLNLVKKNAKKGDPLILGGEAFTIVNVSSNEVIFQAKSNQKQISKQVK